MAPGACGVYNGFLHRESVMDVMRKKVHNQERHRDGKHTHGGDLKFGSQRVCKDFVKSEKPYVDTFDLNGRDKNMQVGSLVTKRFADLESGELCSEDSSGIVDEFLGQGDVSLCRKRKLSQIERCVDEGKKNSNCRQKDRNNVWVAIESHSSLNSKSSEPTSTKKVKKSEDLLADRRISADFMEGLRFDNGSEPEQMTKDRGAVSTISLSRWANANEDDEGATSDVKFLVNRRKCMLLGSAQDQKAELGEVVFRDGSERSSSKVSSSGVRFLHDNLLPVEDSNGDMDVYEEESNIENVNESLEEDCKAKTLDNAESPCRSVNMLQACRSVDDFDKLNKINEGAYGIVYRARDKKSGEIVALKKVKIQKEREGFPLTSLREINILLSLHHHSIVQINEVVVGRDLDDIFIVMEYMEHDLKGLLQTMKKPFHLSEVKCLMLQLLSGVKHLHDNWVLHRDLKTSNLLFNNRGELKICDFGLSRHYGSPLKPYTKLVVTLWYRAPELLLGANEYSTAIDMWSVGCVMAELLNREPLFPGKSDLDQLDKIFKILGTPDEDTWPGLKRLPGAKVDFVKKPFKLHEKFPRLSSKSFLDRPMLSVSGFNLLNRLLTYDPEERITAEDALDHPWFRESPLPMSKDFMPTFPAQHRKARHQQRFMKSPYPQYLGAHTSLDESVERIMWSTTMVFL